MQPRGTRGGPSRGAGRGGGRGRGAPREGPTLVGRGPSAGQGTLQSGSTPLIAAHVRATGVKRPGFGTAGTRTRVIVNALEMVVPDDTMFYHYDVCESTPDKTFPPRLNVQLIKALQHDIAPQVFTPAGAYDGKKNLFMPHRLNLGAGDSRVFDVTLPANGSPHDRPPPVYRVKISFAAEINATVLLRSIQGNQSQDEQVLTALTALNVIIRADPIMNHPFNTRSFYPINGERRGVGHGFELVRGYFQSVRPAIGKMLVNVDISTGLFFKPGPLFEVAFDFFNMPGNRRDPSMFSARGGFDARKRHSLQRFLTGVRVSVAPSNRIIVVSRLSDVGADSFRFSLREGGGQITVADHFRRQENRPLRYPSVFCVMNSKGSAIPFEKCTVLLGQIARKQIPPELTKEMVNFSRKRPEERMQNIRQGIQLLSYGQSEYVRSFGLAVNSGAFLETDARVIDPPRLKYGQGSKQPTILPQAGSWNMLDKKFINPIRIDRWVIVVFESPRTVNEAKVRDMIKGYLEACNLVGVVVAERDPVIHYANGQGNIANELKAAGKACVDKNRAGGPDLMVVILPDQAADIYRAVKHFGDCVMGVATQCLRSGNCRKANNQYWMNVCLKTNPKLGGVNVVPDSQSAPLLVDPNNPTIVMGADVMHPAPGSSSPSFTAVVGNVDTNVSKYIATSNVQESRVEIIQDLGSMVKTILTNYRDYRERAEKVARNSSAPKRLIFFRDGVSEGQFTQVRDQEIQILRDVCAELKIKVDITFIVVGKRHHYRFIPPQGMRVDKSGNMPAGTVVDRGITHPIEFDFYLLSHGGLIGTSRPSHYNVLYDDNNFTVDGLQSLCYTLCCVYARATRTVSIPAPVYYADIVCARAKNHFDPLGNVDMSDTATQISGSAGGGMDLNSYKAAYKQVTGSMARRMYFMAD
ncbi:argonaute-like protein [Dendrothele bispora CBS 962.96]|uniref:Argonaute-like protein n=1 Tax=Dendrothele bispora (strain CBS 962.96) TaxID=1314807 RepID=A0A4S8M6G7_DENBC|nr:argonaute-like protein [Dendrothele bispora CBS 962.96]